MARAKKVSEKTVETKGACKDAIEETHKPKMSAARKRYMRIKRMLIAQARKNK